MAFVPLRETRPDEKASIVDTPATKDHWVEPLEKLAQLHQSGALDAAEFAARKARLIAETESASEDAFGRADIARGCGSLATARRSHRARRVCVAGLVAAVEVGAAAPGAMFASLLVPARTKLGAPAATAT